MSTTRNIQNGIDAARELRARLQEIADLIRFGNFASAPEALDQLAEVAKHIEEGLRTISPSTSADSSSRFRAARAHAAEAVEQITRAFPRRSAT
jgi:hypothetical protein